MGGATEITYKTTYKLLEIAIPSATDTYATDLNDRGEIVGYTEPPSGLPQGQGFVYAQGVFNILPVPVLPVPLAINNAGEVVGGYIGHDGDDAAFLYQGGAVSELFSRQGFFGADAFLGVAGLNDDGVIAGNIFAQNNDRGFIYDHGIARSLRDDLRAAFPTNPPGMDITGDFRAITTGINNQGEVIGVYRAVQSDADNSPRFGLVDDNGAVTLLQVPGAANTDAFGINDAGEIVGGSDVGAFIYENGIYTVLNAPQAATGTTVAEDVNDQGDIIGNYNDAAGISHGFVYRDGTYTTLDAPGAVSTTLLNINSTGEIVGNYTAADGTNHAFLAMPTNDMEPTLIQPHGDVLDLKQVLAEEQIDLEGDVGKLAAYVTVSTSGQDATVSFNPDGAASGPGSALPVLHGIGPKVSLDALLHDGILIA